MRTHDYEVELNNHIYIASEEEDYEEYVPYMLAKRMIADREKLIAQLLTQSKVRDVYVGDISLCFCGKIKTCTDAAKWQHFDGKNEHVNIDR